MPPNPSLEAEDEHYASSEDSDFAPDAAPEPASDESESEDATTHGPSKRKCTETIADGKDKDDGYDNSGDEAIIAKGQKGRKRAHAKGQHVDDEEGGEGGLVKTRAQRAAE